jgi:dynactin 1
MGTLHQEMLQQEKAIDFYVELLRKDQLDENVQLDALEKVVNYFNSIYAVQFSSVINGVHLLTDHSKVLLASFCGLTALGTRVQAMMQVRLLFSKFTCHPGDQIFVCIVEWT